MFSSIFLSRWFTALKAFYPLFSSVSVNKGNPTTAVLRKRGQPAIIIWLPLFGGTQQTVTKYKTLSTVKYLSLFGSIQQDETK